MIAMPRLLVCCLLLLPMVIGVPRSFMAQTTNPVVADCGLPAGGTIVSDVTYTLTANCTQTSRLFILSGKAVTIEGGGYTVNASGLAEAPFDSEGDNTLVVNNLTIDGSRDFNRGSLNIGGSATVKNVTIRNVTGVAIWTKIAASDDEDATVTLENILIENIASGYGHLDSLGAAIYATNNSNVTVTNLTLSEIFGGTAALGVRNGGSITLEGCLTAERIFPRLVSARAGQGTVTDNSTGSCTGTIGNGDSSAVAVAEPAPTSCGLPAGGYLVRDATYRLRGDCQLTDTLYIPDGTTVTIEGNANTIQAAPESVLFRSAANLTIRNVRITGAGARTMILYLQSRTLIERTIFSSNGGPLVVADNRLTLKDVVFENTNAVSQSTTLGASALQILYSSIVVLENVIFRNNTGGSAVIYGGFENVLGHHPTVTLRGCVTWDNNTPQNINDPNDYVTDETTVVCPELTLTRPTVNNDIECNPHCHSNPLSSQISAGVMPLQATECSSGEGLEAIPIGSVACIFRTKRKRQDTVLSLYGVSPQSTGFHLLTASQRQFDSAPAGSMIAVSHDGRGLLLKTREGHAAILVGPDHEQKIQNVILEGGLFGRIISTFTTYGPAPGLLYRARPTDVSALQNCQVTSRDVLNLRREPNGEILDLLPWTTTVPASERRAQWFKVVYKGITGWISANYVTTLGDCA